MKWQPAFDCIHPGRFWNRRKFWSGFCTKKVLMSLSNFQTLRLYKSQYAKFTKSVFQSRQELVQTKWGQKYDCINPSRFWKRRNFWSGFSTKKVIMSLSNFQTLRLYTSRYARFTKSVFQSSQGLVQLKWGLEFWSGVASKKVLMSLSNFALIKLSVCRFTKSVFQSSHELVQMKWRQEFECMHPSRLWNRRNFWSGFSTKKVLMSLSNFQTLRLYKSQYAKFTKSVFQSRQELVQTKWGQKYDCINPSRFWKGRNFWSGFSTKKVIMSLSNFQTLHLYKSRYDRFTKKFFNLVKDMFKWNEVYSFDLVWFRKKVLMSLSNFALKNCRYAVSQKVILNLVMSLLKWNDGKSSSV